MRIQVGAPHIMPRRDVPLGWVFTYRGDNGNLRAARYFSFGPTALNCGILSYKFNPKTGASSLAATPNFDTDVAVVGKGTILVADMHNLATMKKLPKPLSILRATVDGPDMFYLGPLADLQVNNHILMDSTGAFHPVSEAEVYTKYKLLHSCVLKMETI